MLNPEISRSTNWHLMIEQLAQHLENYCTSRTAEGATKEDMESGNVWNKRPPSLYLHNFYHKFLQDINGQRSMTSVYFGCVREHCGYDTDLVE